MIRFRSFNCTLALIIALLVVSVERVIAGLEALTGASVFIDDLVSTNPLDTDPFTQGDDHIRGIKNVLVNSFPGITGAVTSTQTELNVLDGVTATTAELNQLDGNLFTNTVNVDMVTPVLNVGTASNLSTGNAAVQVGNGRTGDGASWIDLVGDGVTYTDYGLRVIRNAGENGGSQIDHRGTGTLTIGTNEVATVNLATDSTVRVAIQGDGDFAVNTNDLFVDESTSSVGIGNTTPGQELDVTGDIQFSGLLYLTGADAAIKAEKQTIANNATGSFSEVPVAVDGDTLFFLHTTGGNVQYQAAFFSGSSTQLSLATGSNVSLGGTTDPNTAGNVNFWVSANIPQVKNLTGASINATLVRIGL